jgi:hypothetical protein
MPRIESRKPYTLDDGITQSMLATFLTCREKSRLQLEGWQSDGFMVAAHRGDLFHKLLEEQYTRKEPLTDEQAVKFVDHVASKWLDKLKKAGPINPFAVEDTKACASALFPHYVKTWRKVDAKFKVEACEEVFDVKWKGFRLRGKFDMVYSIGKRWLFETKSKATIDSEILDALEIDFQNLFYLTALKIMGRPAIGVNYNIIRKPGHKQKKNEDLKTFTARLEGEVIKNPGHFFKRYEVIYTLQQIERFEKELYFLLVDFGKWVKGELPTYRNQTACIGRMKCPFLKYCSSGSFVGFSKTRVLFRELLPE